MARYICFDDQGKALQQGFCLDGDEHLQRPEAQVLVIVNEHFNVDYRDVYFDGKIKRRPENPATLEGLHLSGLPVPSVIEISNGSVVSGYTCNDGSAALSFEWPGTYRVVVQAFPFQDAVFNVEVP